MYPSNYKTVERNKGGDGQSSRARGTDPTPPQTKWGMHQSGSGPIATRVCDAANFRAHGSCVVNTNTRHFYTKIRIQQRSD